MAIEMRPINIGKVREKLEKLKNPSAFKTNNDVWKPKKLDKGKTVGEPSTVRIIRNPHDDDPFIGLWFHYDVGDGPNKSFLCLKKNYGKDCPVCQFASELWNSEEDADKDQAKKLFANNRQHAIVIDREEKDPTPRYWGFGSGVYNELVSKLEHADYKDFMNYYDGIDLEVKYVKDSAAKKFPNTSLTFSRKNSPLASNDDAIKAILNKIKKPEEVWKALSAEEIKKQLDSWLGSPGEGSGETVKGGNGSTASSTADLTDEPEETMTEADVSAAFDSALADEIS